jgi:WD40 repeat protein
MTNKLLRLLNIFWLIWVTKTSTHDFASLPTQNTGTVTPFAREKITPTDASQVVQLARIGQGLIVPDYAAQAIWSPDGKTLAVGSTIGIWMYDATDFNKTPHLLEAHNSLPLYGVAFSPDGHYLAATSGHDYSWGDDNSVRLWDLKTDTLIATMKGYQGTVQLVTFTADSKYLIAAVQGTLTEWEVPTGRPKISVPADISSMALSHDGARLATLGYAMEPAGYHIKLWDPTSLQYKNTIDIPSTTTVSSFNSLVFNADDKTIIVGSDTTSLWDIATGKQIQQFPGLGNVSGLDISPDGKNLAVASYNQTLQLWSFTAQKQVWSNTYATYPHGLKFSPNGQYLALVMNDNSVVIANARTGAEVALLRWDDFTGPTAAISPDGNYIAASTGQEIEIIDTNTYQQVSAMTDKAAGVIDLLFSHDGKRLAGIGYEHPTTYYNPNYTGYEYIRLWDTSTGKLLANSTENSSFQPTDLFAFTTDNKRLVTVTGYTVTLWDGFNGSELAALPNLVNGPFYSVSPDGQYVADFFSDKPNDGVILRVWEIITGHQMPVPEEAAGTVAFSPDGKYIADQTADALNLWNIRTGKKIASFKGYFGEDLTFSPDGTLLAGSGGFSDPTIYLFNAATGQELVVLTGHLNSQVTSLDFSGDGTF